MLGMSRPFLAKLLDEGYLPFHRNGRDRRIAVSDVLSFIEERDRLKREHADVAATYRRSRGERLAELAGISAEEADELGFG
jgi:excisionase family DNA binding protein